MVLSVMQTLWRGAAVRSALHYPAHFLETSWLGPLRRIAAMHSLSQARLALAPLLLATGCWAQPAPAGNAASAPASPISTTTAAAAPATAAKPNAIRQVLEDDNVRIEETRTRGEVQRITVQSKLPGVKGYDIVPLAARKDPSQEGGAAGSAGLAGKRTWSLLDF
jgi:hypothetical protein